MSTHYPVTQVYFSTENLDAVSDKLKPFDSATSHFYGKVGDPHEYFFEIEWDFDEVSAAMRGLYDAKLIKYFFMGEHVIYDEDRYDASDMYDEEKEDKT